MADTLAGRRGRTVAAANPPGDGQGPVAAGALGRRKAGYFAQGCGSANRGTPWAIGGGALSAIAPDQRPNRRTVLANQRSVAADLGDYHQRARAPHSGNDEQPAPRLRLQTTQGRLHPCGPGRTPRPRTWPRRRSPHGRPTLIHGGRSPRAGKQLFCRERRAPRGQRRIAAVRSPENTTLNEREPIGDAPPRNKTTCPGLRDAT